MSDNEEMRRRRLVRFLAHEQPEPVRDDVEGAESGGASSVSAVPKAPTLLALAAPQAASTSTMLAAPQAASTSTLLAAPQAASTSTLLAALQAASASTLFAAPQASTSTLLAGPQAASGLQAVSQSDVGNVLLQAINSFFSNSNGSSPIIIPILIPNLDGISGPSGIQAQKNEDTKHRSSKPVVISDASSDEEDAAVAAIARSTLFKDMRRMAGDGSRSGGSSSCASSCATPVRPSTLGISNPPRKCRSTIATESSVGYVPAVDDDYDPDNSEEDEDEVKPTKKRGPGRPPGSKNKKACKDPKKSPRESASPARPKRLVCKICRDEEVPADHVTSCGHVFHKSCVEKWLRVSKQLFSQVKTCSYCGQPYTSFIRLYED